MKKYLNKNNIFTILIIIFAAILFYFHFIRIFDGNFWGDEGYTIRLSKMSFDDMIDATAGDVHPPLYYFIVQILCKVFGYKDFVYHLSSIIPYLLTLIVSLTIVRKKWGNEAALILIGFSSLLEHSIQFTVEARMYYWGALFLLLSYLMLHNIIEYGRWRDYAWFTFFGLCAAYTHYYCLVSVTFFYAAILLYMIIKKKFAWGKLAATYGITILCYLPWFYFLLKTFIKTSSDYWIPEYPSFTDCMEFLFDCKYHDYFLIILVIGLILALLIEFRMLISNYKGKKLQPYSLNTSGLTFSNFAFYLLIGVVSIAGTALGGIIVSVLFRPMFIVRYLFPVSIIAWLLIGICISKLKYKFIYSILITILICSCGIPVYQNVRSREIQQNEQMKYTLEMTQDIYNNNEDCILLSDEHALKWTVLEYCYPEFERDMIDISDLTNELPHDKSAWLFLTRELTAEELTALESQNVIINSVLNQGHLGEIDVWVYYVPINH